MLFNIPKMPFKNVIIQTACILPSPYNRPSANEGQQ